MLKQTIKEMLQDYVKEPIFEGKTPDSVFDDLKEIVDSVQKDTVKLIKNLKI